MNNGVPTMNQEQAIDEVNSHVIESSLTNTFNINNNNGKSTSVNYEKVLSSAATRLVPLSEEEQVAMLSSLPQRPVANFPSEADRKRIIGCLAIIIKTTYDYHIWDPRCPSVKQEMSKENEKKTSAIDNRAKHTGNAGKADSTDCMEGITSNSIDMDSSFLDQTPSSTSNDVRGRRGWRQQRTKAPAMVDKRFINHRSRHGNGQKENRDNEPNNIPNNLKNDKPVLFERHRRRRHFVFQKFLEEAADLLFLDKCHAIAFLPMLNSLLMEPLPVKTRTNIDHSVQQTSSQYRPAKITSPRKHGNSVESNDDYRCNIRPQESEEEELILNQYTEQIFGDSQGKYHNTACQNSCKQQNNVFDEKLFPACDSVSLDPAQTDKITLDRNSVARGETFDGSGIEFTENISENTMPLQTWDKNDLMEPFVESLTPGAGFQCVALLLVNHLLHSGHGYDARIRHAIKKLAVIVIVHEFKQNDYDDDRGISSSNNKSPDDDSLVERAARKFEALEHFIAVKLLRISVLQQEKEQAEKEKAKGQIVRTRQSNTEKRDAILRGLKVGSIGLAAGALFAVTGGIAAPGIVAALTASGITMTTALTSTAAVGTIFGVGGGGLVAYKTHRRTKGLTDFVFHYEKKITDLRGRNKKKDKIQEDAELFTTVCISGWLKNLTDFQRPWGVTPTNPSIDRAEKLARFYSVYKPENVQRCQDILKKWRGDERRLWSILKQKYGRDPDHLLPLDDGPRIRASLTHEEDEALDNLLAELGYSLPREENKESSSPLSDMLEKRSPNRHTDYSEGGIGIGNESPTKPFEYSFEASNSSGFESSQIQRESQELNIPRKVSNPTTTAWDYHAEYGGELYTVHWESDLLMELCDSVEDMAIDLAGNAAKEILKQTALATLITSLAVPYALIRAANMIDGTWTLAIERADLAGIELARSLLGSKAGHRPIVLVGFSMGARTIYACLKELARHQELWEDEQDEGIGQKDMNKRRQNNTNKDNLLYTREPASIVEDAILLGTPNHMSHQSWEACRCIVAGRLVNCYSKNDLILSLMFQINRLSGGLKPVCGTSPVEVSGVENYDVSPFISAHSDYCTMIPYILRMVRHGLPHRPTARIVAPTEFLEKNGTSSGIT